jgi:hypothetical protein
MSEADGRTGGPADGRALAGLVVAEFTVRPVRPVRPSACPPCNRCGFPVRPAPWGCKNPCGNCGTIYPHGDCSD